MPIDASIPLQARAPQLADPAEVQGRVMQLRHLASQQQLQDMQFQQAQRAQQQEQELADLYRGSVDPSGNVNRQAVITGAAQRGLGSKIPGLQKQFADADKATADVGHTKAQTAELDFKVAKAKMDASANAISALVSNPQVTHQDVINTMVSLVQQGIVSPEQGQQAIRNLPSNPGMLRSYLMQEGMKVMDASKRLEALTPKMTQVDSGSQISFVDTNPLTNPGGPGAIKKTVTPDAAMREGGEERRSKRTDERERALAGQGVTYQQNDNGDFVALPTKAAPGAVIKASPVLAPGSGLQPLTGKSNMTEDQGKASGWLAQANNAYKNAMDAVQKNAGALTPGVGDAVGKVPGMGAAGRVLMSPERQQFNQAMSTMSEAFLRAATGAGINRDEAQQKINELTPQFGDAPEVIKQKMDSIPVYLKSLEMRAGPGAKKLGGAAKPAAPAAVSSGAKINFDLPDDIMAILSKHGVK